MTRVALIAGVSGIVGNNLARRLIAEGWEVLGLARPEDVLEEGETVDPHLVPVAAQEPFEAAHEHGQHLIDIDHHEWRVRVELQVGDFRRQGKIGQDRLLWRLARV